MKNSLAIVTGTSRGVGQALVENLTEKGWSVVGAARGPSPCEHPGYRHYQVDLADPQALTRWVVNNAALIGALAWLRESEADFLKTLFAVNVAAPIYLMGWLVRNAPAGADLRIVNISSGAAHSPLPGLGDYSATKAALRLAGRTLAAELELEGRRPAQAAVFSYEPGLVDTHMQDVAREASPDLFPAHATFMKFAREDLLCAPRDVVVPIVEFLMGEPAAAFTESRFC